VTSSPLLDLVRAAALVMLLFSAILIFVVIRNLEAPFRFGTRSGPLLVGLALVLFAIPIYAEVAGSAAMVRASSVFRIGAALLLPVGLYLMKPLTRRPPGSGSDKEVLGDDA
jgi:hypothetical protein